jgi:hypothetical protein
VGNDDHVSGTGRFDRRGAQVPCREPGSGWAELDGDDATGDARRSGEVAQAGHDGIRQAELVPGIGDGAGVEARQALEVVVGRGHDRCHVAKARPVPVPASVR